MMNKRLSLLTVATLLTSCSTPSSQQQKPETKNAPAVTIPDGYYGKDKANRLFESAKASISPNTGKKDAETKIRIHFHPKDQDNQFEYVPLVQNGKPMTIDDVLHYEEQRFITREGVMARSFVGQADTGESKTKDGKGHGIIFNCTAIDSPVYGERRFKFSCPDISEWKPKLPKHKRQKIIPYRIDKN